MTFARAAGLALLASACATAAPPPASPRALDLSTSLDLAGRDERAAVVAQGRTDRASTVNPDPERARVLAVATRVARALAERDFQALLELYAPVVGGVLTPGVSETNDPRAPRLPVPRETLVAYHEAMAQHFARSPMVTQREPRSARSFRECLRRSCPSALLGPGEWLVEWGSSSALHAGTVAASVMPWSLRIAEGPDGPRVVGVTDEVVAASLRRRRP